MATFSHLAPVPLTPQDLTFTVPDQVSFPTVSGSSSPTQDYLDIFHIVFKQDLPSFNVIPTEFRRSPADVRAEFPNLFALDESAVLDLHEIRDDPAIKPIMMTSAANFYDCLRDLIVEYVDDSSDSQDRDKDERETVQDKDKHERDTEAALVSLDNELRRADDCLDLLVSLLTKLNMPNHQGQEYFLVWRKWKRRYNLRIHKHLIKVFNGGYLLVEQRRTDRSKKAKVRDMACMFITAKRYAHWKTVEGWKVQLGSEFLAIAQENHKRGAGDQEVFALDIEHRKARIMHALIPEAYLRELEVGIPNGHIVIKKTKEFDIADPQERLEFATEYDAVLRYLKSGESGVGQLKGWGR
ncbi:hypothetical protein HK104_001796 [Borealophlyctis nickersoniae]|nr:hypothetical protein HK104_001796 [Borealophlyctis nickersoniae]